MANRKLLAPLFLSMLGAALCLGQAACAPFPRSIKANLPSPPPPREPLRWIMVEARADSVYPDGQIGDGQVSPSSQLLTMVPLYREDFSWEVVVDPRDYFVEVLEVLPKGLATPGETVMATVRGGGAKPAERYRLQARPQAPDVTLIGEAEREVRGAAPAVFRFTSTSTGRGGIAVGVERIGPGEPPSVGAGTGLTPPPALVPPGAPLGHPGQ